MAKQEPTRKIKSKPKTTVTINVSDYAKARGEEYSHRHEYSVNKKGKGRTLSTIEVYRSSKSKPHTHKVINGKIQPYEGHSHEPKWTNKSIVEADARQPTSNPDAREPRLPKNIYKQKQ